MASKNFKCTVSYTGTGYHGWQKQASVVTVQGIIEYALEKFFKKKINITAASRTDSGVHAFGNVFNFKADTPIDAKGLKSVINSMLPADIRIMKCSEADDKFSSRHAARKKFYRYAIYNRRNMRPMYSNFAWHIPEKIDIEKMREILPAFKGMKNYFTFSTAGSDRASYERELRSITIKKQGAWITIDYKGRSFVYNMLRKITAALVFYARGEFTKEQIAEMFEKQDRSLLQYKAPAQGLYLIKIIY
jgi:tRNA pseudouridine38-40 synthase